MSSPSPIRLTASVIALLLFLFFSWQVIIAAKRVQAARTGIAELQNQEVRHDQISPEQWVIRAGSHGAAGAQVQARLRASARSADISLTRVEIQPPDKANPTLVRATAQANGQTKAMAKFMYLLESETPALIIERARISKDGETGLDVDLVILARVQIEDQP